MSYSEFMLDAARKQYFDGWAKLNNYKILNSTAPDTPSLREFAKSQNAICVDDPRREKKGWIVVVRKLFVTRIEYVTTPSGKPYQVIGYINDQAACIVDSRNGSWEFFKSWDYKIPTDFCEAAKFLDLCKEVMIKAKESDLIDYGLD